MLAFAEHAQAQEIYLTGPLAGAPAVRKLRLYREGRFEASPAVSFTLLDEYQRTILLGARLNYNFTDWLAVGAWGGFGGALQLNTGLTDRIQEVNLQRKTQQPPDSIDNRLTAVNLGEDFEDQISTFDWVIAPQLTGVPFRGKIALFESIYIDTDLYFFGGPAFVGLSERGDCESGNCAWDPDAPGRNLQAFQRESRVAVAPTAGLGFTFYVNEWSAIGFEYRILLLSRNTGGFDVAGGGQDDEFPDQGIDDDDRLFKPMNMLTLSYNFYLPTQYRVSE